MPLHSIVDKIVLPVSLPDAWNFFSNPQNLSLLTPPDLGLQIHTDAIEAIYPGLIITYDVKPFPLPFITMNWITEITHVRDGEFFVDEQRFGPYRFWHHKHYFREVSEGMEKGTEVRDVVHYLLPLLPPGISSLVHKAIVRPRLESIFAYRRKVLAQFKEAGRFPAGRFPESSSRP
jgi:ligand-binding SRPBCC domain-containing protein